MRTLDQEIRRAVAIDAARESGMELLKYWDGLGNQFYILPPNVEEIKSSISDYSTVADKASQSAIFAALAQCSLTKHDGIESEEYKGILRPKAKGRWILDPLDGTGCHRNRRDTFANSVCYEENGVALIGAIAMPSLNRLIIGQQGYEGVAVNLYGRRRKPISLKKRKEQILARPIPLEQGCVMVNKNYVHRVREINEMDIPLAPVVGGLLSNFCDVAGLMGIVFGELVAYVQGPHKKWDIAASLAVLSSLNYPVTTIKGERHDLRNGNDFSVVTARDERTHERILNLLNK